MDICVSSTNKPLIIRGMKSPAFKMKISLLMDGSKRQSVGLEIITNVNLESF